MWPHYLGEEIYYDNLGDLTFDELFNVDDNNCIADMDQYYSRDSEDEVYKRGFIAVGRDEWYCINVVSWAPVTDGLAQANVRVDCTPDVEIDNYTIESFEQGEYFTCVCSNSACPRYSFAGTSQGQIVLLDCEEGDSNIVSAFPNPAKFIQRIFQVESDPNLLTSKFVAWRRNGTVLYFSFDCATGLVTALNTWDGTAHDITEIRDVCKSPNGYDYVFVGYDNNASQWGVFWINYAGIIGAVAPTSYLQPITVVSPTVYDDAIDTYALAYSDNSHVWVFPNTYTRGVAAQIYMIDLEQAAPNAALVSNDLYYALFDCVGFTNNGDYAILCGRVWDYDDINYPNEYMQESIRIWKITVTRTDQSPSIDATPLYTIKRSGYQHQPWSSGPRLYPVHRMRKRHNKPQWFLISNENTIDELALDKKFMTVGEPPESPTPEIDSVTSTSIKLKWSKPESYNSEEDISHVKVWRSETCEPDDWECVYATETMACSYDDNQHPTEAPRQIEAVWQEIGLVDQLPVADGGAEEVDFYNPLNDTFPDGRKFYYKVSWIDYLGLQGESEIIEGTTAVPIPPVHIKDTLSTKFYDWDVPYNDVDIQSEEFTLQWEWLALFGSISAEYFDRWDVAIYEELVDLTGIVNVPDLEPSYINNHYVYPWIDVATDPEFGFYADRGAVVDDVSALQATVKELENYPSDVETRVPIIPYVSHWATVIGWDTGGLFRLSATQKREKLDWNVERQDIIRINTGSKPSGVIEIEDVERDLVYDGEPEYKYRDLVFARERDVLSADLAGVTALGNQQMFAIQFEVRDEIEIIGYRLAVASIDGPPSDLRFVIYDDAGGLPNVPLPAAAATLDVPWGDVTPSGIGPSGVPDAYDYYMAAGTTFVLRPGTYHLVITTALGALEPNGQGYNIFLSEDLSALDRPGEFYVPFVWADDPDMQPLCGIVCKGYASEAIAFQSGYVHKFHTGNTTDVKLADETLIYEYYFHAVNDEWNFLGASPPTIPGTGGYVQFLCDGTGNSSRLELNHYEVDGLGANTRNYAVYCEIEWVQGDRDFEILLRNQTDYAAQMDCIKILYEENQPRLHIQQGHVGQAFTDLATTDFELLEVGHRYSILIKIIDGAVYVYMTDITDEGYAWDRHFVGLANVKGRILDTANYPFIDHGRPFHFVQVGPTLNTTHYLYHVRIFGKPTTDLYNGGQGYWVDYGDRSDSGYFRIDNIQKMYYVESNISVKEWESITHPINEYDAEDWGMYTIDFEDEISSHIVNVKALNSLPICSLDVPEVAYTDQLVFLDMSQSYDPDGGTLQYYIDWGDGTTENGTGALWTHIYTTAGVYTIEGYVVDEHGDFSTICSSQITVTEQYSNLYELIPNFPFQNVSPTRDDGMSTFNLPEMCGSETHATGGGTRKFNVKGIHIDTCCCSSLIDSYVQVKYWEDGAYTDCDDIEYETAGVANSGSFVGDQIGVGGVDVKATEQSFVNDTDICAVSFHVSGIVASGTDWDVVVDIQGDAAGQPDGVSIATSRININDIAMGWNTWTFSPEVTMTGGVTYWFVLYPDPCPIGTDDYITVDGVSPPPVFNTSTSQSCPAAPFWIDINKEIIRRVYSSTTYAWIESDTPDGGLGMKFSCDDERFADATHLKFVLSLCKSADFNGDLEFRLVSGLNPQTQIMTRGEVQLVENDEISVCDGNNHYIELEFIGCPDDMYGEDIYLIITTKDATAGSFFVRMNNGGGNLVTKDAGSNTWVGDVDANAFHGYVYIMATCMDLAFCEYEEFDALDCSKQVFKVELPYFGTMAVIMSNYVVNLDEESPTWMEYSMTLTEICN